MTEQEATLLSSSNNPEGDTSSLAETNTAVANNQTGAQQPQQPPPSRLESFFSITKSLLLRALVIYFISSMFRSPASQQQQNTSVKSQSGDGNLPAAQKAPAWNYFENGVVFDLYVYLSNSYDFVDFTNQKNLIWLQEGLTYGDWTSGQSSDGTYMNNVKIKATPQLMKNGSIYIHSYVVKTGKSPDPNSKYFANQYLGYARRMLNKYKKIKTKRDYNLLNYDENEVKKLKNNAIEKKDLIISHWHPNLTINLVIDQTNWGQGSVPQPLDEYVHFVDQGRTYLPILFLNDYWNMLRDYQPINETTPDLELYLTFQPLSMFKWQLYAAQSMKNKWANMFGDMMATSNPEETDEEQDTIKETLLETNPYLLGLTIVISILHSIFELLAFKNDIQFWNNRKSLEGLSVRSVFFNVFQAVIVLLYVLDNETNFMIRISCLIGLGIEVWKIQKVTDVKYDPNNKILGFLPRIEFNDKGSYIASSTKQYDELAFKYLGWLCFPLLIGYSIYSLVYNDHKGWYSFILNMLYGFLLTFGFIMMTPQLFINYKLKSVAHLPWRMMTYKFLNTFIDDIFAFVIKMPTMYRLGCFRDDIVFFVFLYQKWVYKVDHKRVNEFGFSGEMINESLANKENSKSTQQLAIDDQKSIEQKKTD